jgi:WG containing repeat
MVRLVLIITIMCITGCSKSADFTTANSGIQKMASQTTKHSNIIPVTYEPKLWPISVEGKWGYIDANGTVKIEPQYAQASPFREGLALVSELGTSDFDQAFKRKYDGFIDETGHFVIPAKFPDFYKKREIYDSYGYSSFEDGVAIVRDASSSSGLKGLIDRKGMLVAPMIYNSVGWSFSEGLCSFEIEHEDGRSERGYMDYQGNVVIRPNDFLYGTGFAEGRAKVTIRNDKGDYELLIDRQGNSIVNPGEYDSISDVQGGLCRVVKGDNVGLIDRDGRIVIPLGEYSQIIEPDPGAIYIGEKNNVFYAIKSDSSVTRLPDFGAKPMRFRGDLIWVRANDDKDGFAKPDGTMIVEPVFDALSSFEGELCKFHKGTEQGYINQAGKIVWSTKHWELPLQYSIREPLQSYLPNFGTEALPLSYNWDCENAIVFVCDGNLEMLRKFYLARRSADVKVEDNTNYDSEPGKIDISISFPGVAYIEIYAIQGDAESKNAEETDDFVSFYACENMAALRKKYPNKTIGIIIEN